MLNSFIKFTGSNKTLRALIYILICSFSALILAILLVDSKIYSNYIDQELIALARKNMALLAIPESDIDFLTYKATNLKLFPTPLVGLEIDHLSATPKITSFLKISPSADIIAKLYGGEIIASFAHSLRNSSSLISASVISLQPTMHPILSGLGFKNASLNAQFNEIELVNSKIVQGTCQIDLTNIEKPNITSYSLKQFGIPLELKLPVISKANIKLNCHLKDPIFNCNFELQSNLANSQGTFSASYPRTKTIAVQAKVALQDEGSKEFSTYLPLISSNSLTSNSKNFEFTLSGAISKPTFKLKPLEQHN